MSIASSHALRITHYSLPMNLPDAVENRSLFSNYYLDSLIVGQSQWTDTPNIESDYAAIKALFDAVAPNAEHLNEAQTEREFIQPLLEQLGHVFEVQPSLQTSQGTRVPDYAFFPSVEVHNTAQPHINTNQFFNTALAIGDAKAWSRNLDRKIQGRGDPFTNHNPNYQIDFYLRGSDKEWGILTNGRQWRLYHRQTSYRLDSFYEVDLAALLSENRGIDTFRYFYCLFRRDAFSPTVGEGPFLDLVLTESQQYTVAVSDDLKNRIYDALRLLIDGFLKFPRNRFDSANPPLDKVHTNCLILLYRILFILYAESRGLLPVENPNYAASYSLAALAETIHETLDRDDLIIPTISDYWARLRGLFGLINDGWDDLIPQYNGGLFNPTSHPFLENNELGNDALARVIELLTRTEQGERIAYRDLDVRHLGDIYEGLLEYQPQIAEQDLIIVSSRGSETVAPQSSPDQEIAYSEGDVYLLTDKGERKATGSYYTPDYIVRYIVQNTLGPLCEGKTVDEILSLKILDPATGSGDFLVGVVDYLAEELITHPDAPHMTETGSEETELAYWRRRVVESCVYGVDLNPMAVELAKLSLWLHTVAKGEPLSFLDHHIRCGNSLIGAKIENLSNLPELRRTRRSTNQSQTEIAMEFPFTDRVATAIGHYLLIEETESRTADQIHAKEHQLDIAQQMLRFHKGVANLWTSVYFDNNVSRSTYQQALNALRSQNTDALENLLSYQRAQAIATERQFFHWEIEFPEVFRDKYGQEKDNPGFDAVVGNPPWGASSDELDKIYYKLVFTDIVVRMVDSFMFFIRCAHGLIRKGGFNSFIIPNTFLTQTDVQRLRLFLLEKSHFCTVVNLGDGVFGHEVTTPSCLFILEKQSDEQRQRERIIKLSDLRNVDNTKRISQIEADSLEYLEIPQSFFLETHNNSILTDGIESSNLVTKLMEDNAQLKDLITDCGIQRGISADLNEAFVVSDHLQRELQLERESLKPIITGHHVTCFFIAPSDEYIIYLTREDNIEEYPRIKSHLSSYRSRITCKEVEDGKHPWFALHRPRNADIFKSPKFVGLTTTDRLIVSLDAVQNLYVMDNLYVFQTGRETSINDMFILSLMNSCLLTFVYRYFAQEKGRILPQVKATNLYLLPIRRINFTTPTDERDRQLEKAKTLYQRCLDRGSTDCVLGFVKHHLTADLERSDVVHDLLAFLAEEMVEMNKTKGEEIRGFLRWLEREIGVEIDTLKNKTKIQGYFDLSLEELLEILRSNRRRIAVDPSSRDFQESLEREFTKSLDKLNPLLTRIEQTDALIDQVVYRLYDLDAEEIAIVESNV